MPTIDHSAELAMLLTAVVAAEDLVDHLHDDDNHVSRGGNWDAARIHSACKLAASQFPSQ